MLSFRWRIFLVSSFLSLDSSADSLRRIFLFFKSVSVGRIDNLRSNLTLILLLISSFSSRLIFGIKFLSLSSSAEGLVDSLLSRFFPILSLFSCHSSPRVFGEEMMVGFSLIRGFETEEWPGVTILFTETKEDSLLV